MAIGIRAISLSDWQMKTCTRWQGPDGVIFLELPKVLDFFQVLAANAAPLFDVELAADGEYDFLAKAVSYTGTTPGTLIQIQWPDGRYLENVGLDYFSFVGTGKRGRGLTIPKLLPAKSKVKINLDNSAVGVQSQIELYIEGVVRVPLIQGS